MPTKRADDNQPITAEWLNEWADKAEFCWFIPGSELFIAKHRDRRRVGLWSILREEADGSETVLENVEDRGEIREVLAVLGVEADGVELVDYE